jgi:hypothetical protein
MLIRLLKAVAVAVIVAAVIQSLPDIKRYLEMRAM